MRSAFHWWPKTLAGLALLASLAWLGQRMAALEVALVEFESRRADRFRRAAEERLLQVMNDYEPRHHACRPVACSTRACRRRIPLSQRSWSSPFRR